MPLQIADNAAPEDFFIFARDDEEVKGALLAPGQTLKVTSADENTVALAVDASTRNRRGFTGFPAPDGTVCIASGKVNIPNPPAVPNVPINCTAAVFNADGTPGTDDKGNAIPPLVDTVEVIPGLAGTLGDLFATPIAPAPASA